MHISTSMITFAHPLVREFGDGLQLSCVVNLIANHDALLDFLDGPEAYLAPFL